MLATSTLVFVQAQQFAFRLRIAGLLAVIAGILILVYPRVLNYVVALYLILVGLLQLFDLDRRG